MKKILKTKKNMKLISMILACCMVIGAVGVPTIAEAAVTTSNLYKYNPADKIMCEDLPEGVKCTYAGDYGWTNLNHVGSLNVFDTKEDGTGIHLEVNNIKSSQSDGGYTFIIAIGDNKNGAWMAGNDNRAWCDADHGNAVILAIESDGDYLAWKKSCNEAVRKVTEEDSHYITGGKLQEELNGAITADIIKTGTANNVRTYKVTINGTSFTVNTPQYVENPYVNLGMFGANTTPSVDMRGSSFVIEEFSAYVSAGLQLDINDVQLDVGEEITLTPTFNQGSSYTAGDIVWQSSNTDVATVANGKVTAVGEGNAVISATVADETVTCSVLVGDKSADFITYAELVTKNGSEVSLKEVAKGAQATFTKSAWNEYVTTARPYTLERGVLYHITNIHEDDVMDGAYSIAFSIGNTTLWKDGSRSSNQWYNKAGYMILYGKSGSFAIVEDFSNQKNGKKIVAVDQIEPLNGTLSLYVREVGNNWVITINDKHTYTIENAAHAHDINSKEYWFSAGTMSDFTVDTANNKYSGLNFWNDPTLSAKSGVSFTISNIAPTVPTWFTDGVLFQQNKPMNIWGYGIAEQSVTAKLYKGTTTELIETRTTTVSETGRWDVAFVGDTGKGYVGGYDTYKMEITVGTDTNATQVINDILIGELWLSGGQSNMELDISTDMDSETILNEAAEQDYIRVFYQLLFPWDATGVQPATPARDISKGFWGNADDTYNLEPDVKMMSSVAYRFAAELQKELNVPVGILNTAVGGTVIEAWLSRDAIEGEATVLGALQSGRGSATYYDETEWASSRSAYNMFNLYNAKIGPLAGMNIAGTIWYQGESNQWTSDIYDEELDLLKRSWGEIFGYPDGDMPFIFTQLAPYSSSTRMVIGYMSLNMTEAWKRSADKNTAMITLYDLPLEHIKTVAGEEKSSHPVHPRTKTPVGERFALAALNMVYGGGDEYTAPVYKSMELKNDAIYITLDHVGNNGLMTTEGSEEVHGFSIAGADGIFVNANAKIVDEDTVMVWNERVSDPKYAIYAFDNLNQGANLCGSVGIPVVPLRAGIAFDDSIQVPNSNIRYLVAQDWMYADKDVWVYESDDATTLSSGYGYKPSFLVEGGASEYTYDETVKAEGVASLKVEYTDDFVISPILTYESLYQKTPGDSVVSQDWSKFNYLTVSMRNSDNVNVSMAITNGTKYTVPTIEGKTAVTLESSDSFTTVTFDLTRLSDDVLKDFTDVTFEVATDKVGEMYFDAFLFGMTDASETDFTAPIINGVSNGATYCEDVVITITDQDLDILTVNGTTVTLTEGKYTLEARDVNGTEYTLFAKDIYGNEVTVKVTVYEGHEWGTYESNHDATCQADGTKTAECNRCDDKDTVADVGSKLAHEFTNYVSDGNATYTEDGTKTAKCNHCEEKDTITDEGSKLTKPAEPDEPENPTKPEQDEQKKPINTEEQQSPTTRDNFNMGMWLLLLVVGMLLVRKTVLHKREDL